MPVGKLILLGLLGLVVAEAAVFLLIAQTFGSFVAIVALMSTSVLGVAVLARMGRRLAGRLADIVSQRDFGAAGTRSSGFLNTVGGLLLVLPGFITDCIGLLLLIPAVQQHLRGRLPSGRPRPTGRILELERSQWRDLPDRHIPGGREPPKVPPKRARRG
jgi:UPF0716 family protein affecting phage T7 exclusion